MTAFFIYLHGKPLLEKGQVIGYKTHFEAEERIARLVKDEDFSEEYNKKLLKVKLVNLPLE